MPILTHLNATYPRIAAAWSNRGALLPGVPAALAARPLGRRLTWELGGYGTSELPGLDGALGALQASGFNTTEQERFLISQKERDFTTGQEEILAIDWFLKVGILRSTGFPAGTGGSPPFDCSVSTPSGATVANDVKTAGATAFLRLEAALQPGTSQWAATHGLSPHYRFQWSGPVTQAGIGSHFGQIRKDWLGHTKTLGSALPTTPFTLNVGSTTIDVTLEKKPASWGGVAGIKTQAQAALDTVENHVNGKTAHGQAFLLTYVRLFMRPMADLRPEPLRSALTTLHRRLSRTGGVAHQRWLGVVYVDLAKHSPEVSAFLRHNATWPATQDPYRMFSHLQAGRWVTRRRSR